jgi:hypothetical protein
MAGTAAIRAYAERFGASVTSPFTEVESGQGQHTAGVEQRSSLAGPD